MKNYWLDQPDLAPPQFAIEICPGHLLPNPNASRHLLTHLPLAGTDIQVEVYLKGNFNYKFFIHPNDLAVPTASASLAYNWCVDLTLNRGGGFIDAEWKNSIHPPDVTLKVQYEY